MSAPTKYRKKPVVIEAMKFDGENLEAVQDWVGIRYDDDPWGREGFVRADEQWVDPPKDITALIWDRLHSTWVGVKDGQWIIRGVQGEFYPCDADVFAATYEPEKGEQ